MDIKEGLTTKLGPFPAWVYGVVGGAAIAAFMYFRRSKSTSTVEDAQFVNEAQNVGWGSAPYAPGPASYDSSGGGMDMTGFTDMMGQMLTEMELQGQERFAQFQASQEEARLEAATRLQEQQQAAAEAREIAAAQLATQRATAEAAIAEQRAANERAQAELINALQSQPAPAPPPPAYVPPPPPPTPAGPASGALIWHGSSKPNMATLNKAHPGVKLVAIENKGHKPGSSHRWIVKAA